MKTKFCVFFLLLPLFIGLVNAEYFLICDGAGYEFVVEINDPSKVEHARNLISGRTTARPHIMGTIIKRPALYNKNWSFKLDPATINFFELAIEVCDANTKYVEEHLNEACGAFLPSCVWCPWSSSVVKEL